MKNKLYILIFFLIAGKILLAQLPGIVQMEYYFDNDPGFGNGTQVSFTSDSIVDVNFNADLSAIDIGYHKLFIRVKDTDGKWSLAFKQDVYKAGTSVTGQPLPDIVAMEYYFDNDPGFGNGESIQLTSDSLVDVNFEADLSLVDVGYHKLFVRTKDENGKWSLVFKQDVYKAGTPATAQPLPDITALEYFVDTDPGFGNGNNFAFNPDSVIDVILSPDLTGVTAGEHNLFYRVKDENGRWSLTNSTSFYMLGLKAFLQGPYDAITNVMNTGLNNAGNIPLQQPFGSNPAAKWYYNGGENVTAVPNNEIVDWVLIQLRDATDAANATGATVKETKAVFLLKDGSITGLDGNAPVPFTTEINDNMYVVIYHRNHLGILSSGPVQQTGENAYVYDFSTDENKVYGGSVAYKQLEPGVWGMVSADGNGDGSITNTDLNEEWKPQAGNAGYLSGDFDLNGQADNKDKNESGNELSPGLN